MKMYSGFDQNSTVLVSRGWIICSENGYGIFKNEYWMNQGKGWEIHGESG